MKTYHFDFIGRENGAIGIRYAISEQVQADDYDAAVLRLYDRYEHISVRHFTAWENGTMVDSTEMRAA